jgi:hypothetical protein
MIVRGPYAFHSPDGLGLVTLAAEPITLHLPQESAAGSRRRMTDMRMQR